MPTEIVIAGALGGLLIANIGSLLGAFVSIKVQLGKIEVKLAEAEKDINNLGRLLRAKKGD